MAICLARVARHLRQIANSKIKTTAPPADSAIVCTSVFREMGGTVGETSGADPVLPSLRVLKMSWLTNSHLEVAYRHNPSLDFQVVKDAGVYISVRALPE